MNRLTLTRTAAVVLIALGMSTVAATAAFADDSPSGAAATSSSPTQSSQDSLASTPDSSGDAVAASEAAAPEATTPAATDPAATTPVAPAAPEAAAATESSIDPAVAEATTGEGTTTALPPTGADPSDPTPYKLLAWQMPCGMADRFCAPGQKLVGVADLAVPSLDALDDLAGQYCGGLQLDLEWDSQATADLIAYGILTAPGQPLMEDHAYVLGEGVGPFKDIDGPACEVAGSVITSATATPQTCSNGTTLVGGTIQVAVIPGVTYTITGSQGTVALDAGTGLATNLAPGAYSVAFALDPTLTTPVAGPIPVSVLPFVGTCAATVTPPTTTTPNVPTALDPVTSVTDPAALSNDQLTTLAVTGSDPVGGLLVAAGALLLGGLLLQLRRLRVAATHSTH